MMTSSVASARKIYLIFMIIPICFAENFCARRYINGKWKTVGNCPDTRVADIISSPPSTLDSCKSNVLGGCYWLAERKSVEFMQAKQICESSGSEVAQIRDDQAFNSSADLIRSRKTKDSAEFWIGMNVLWVLEHSPMHNTHNLNTNARKPHQVHPYITVAPPNLWQGMKNCFPNILLEGVVCWNMSNTSQCNISIQVNQTAYCIMILESGIKFIGARRLCEDERGDIAQIPNDEAYIAITSAIQKNISSDNQLGLRVWISPGASGANMLYRNWFYGFPKNESNRTNLQLYVQGFNVRTGQTRLARPERRNGGVVCWRNNSANCHSNYSVTVDDKGCFEVIISRGIKYSTAAEICKKENATIARIPDKSTFAALVEVIRYVDEIPGRKPIWVDMDVNWVLRMQPCRGAFYKWYTGYPQRINGPVSISVKGNETGMKNHRNSETLDGVLCWKPFTRTQKSNFSFCVNSTDRDQNQYQCFWVVIQTGKPLINLNEAEDICGQNNATIATTVDKVTKHTMAIGEYISSNLLMDRALVWFSKDEQNEYDQPSIFAGGDSASSKNVYMVIDKNECNSEMVNATSASKAHGVVCLKESPYYS